MQDIGFESAALADILRGAKTIEVRLGKSKYIKMRVGDVLSLREDIPNQEKTIQSVNDRTRIIITQLLYFETLEELLSSVDFRRILPHAGSVHNALKIYQRHHSEADVYEYGVVAITFKLAS